MNTTAWKDLSTNSDLSWNLLSALLPIVGSFLVSIFLAPYLGDALWGRYSLVMTATTLWLILAKFGVHAATSRLVAEHEGEEGSWIRAGLLLRLISTIVVAGLSTATALPLARSFGLVEGASVFLWIAPVLVAASFYEFASEVLVGLRRFRGLLAARCGFLVLRFTTVAAIVLGGHGLGDFLGGHALSQFLPAILALVLLWRWYPTRLNGSLEEAIRRTWQLSVPLAFGSASFLIFSHTDRLMLGWFWDESTVGQFSVARNVLDASLFPMTALAWTLRPALVRAAKSHRHIDGRQPGHSRKEFPRQMRRGARFAGAFAFAAPLALGLLGPPLLVLIYGATYQPAADLLRWMVPILMTRAIGVLIFPALIALDEQAHYAHLMIATAAVNVGANLLLIPRLGPEGAILGTVVALLVLTLGGYLRIHRRRGFSLTS